MQKVYAYCNNNPINCNDPTGKDAQSVASNAAQGFVYGVGGAVAVGAVAVGAVAVGVPVAAVTAGLGALAIAGTAITSYNIGTGIQNGNWDSVAYNTGSLLGGLTAGAAGGRVVAEGINGQPSGPFVLNDSFQNYQPGLGSVWTWLGTGPNVGSAALSVGASGAGAASAADGGFVLYPNKSNTNAMISVYKK